MKHIAHLTFGGMVRMQEVIHPEQLIKAVIPIDPRCDVWGFGGGPGFVSVEFRFEKQRPLFQTKDESHWEYQPMRMEFRE